MESESIVALYFPLSAPPPVHGEGHVVHGPAMTITDFVGPTHVPRRSTNKNIRAACVLNETTRRCSLLTTQFRNTTLMFVLLLLWIKTAQEPRFLLTFMSPKYL